MRSLAGLVILRDPWLESKPGCAVNVTSTEVNTVLDHGSQCCVLHAYIYSLDPSSFLRSTKCSPFLADGWVGAGCTNYRRKDSEKDGEHAKVEHIRARKGVRGDGQRFQTIYYI